MAVTRTANAPSATHEISKLRRAQVQAHSGDYLGAVAELVSAYRKPGASAGSKKSIAERVARYLVRHAKEASKTGDNREASQRYFAAARLCMALDSSVQGSGLENQIRNMLTRASDHAYEHYLKTGKDYSNYRQIEDAAASMRSELERRKESARRSRAIAASRRG